MSLELLARIDPPGCGCTDCLTGYSIPLRQASETQVMDLAYGCSRFQDATGADWARLRSRMESAANAELRRWIEEQS